MEFQIRLVYLDCLRWTYRNTSHTPDTIMLSNWIGFICIVLSFFLNRTASTCTCSINHVFCWYILLCPIPLEDLDWTSLNTSPISDTRIPINCDHSTVNSRRGYLLSPCR